MVVSHDTHTVCRELVCAWVGQWVSRAVRASIEITKIHVHRPHTRHGSRGAMMCFNKRHRTLLSWCSRSRIPTLGRSDKWRKGSRGPFLGLVEHAAPRQPDGAACDLKKNTKADHLGVLFEVCYHGSWKGSQWTFRELIRPHKAQDGVLGQGTAPTRTPTAPLGGGGQAAMQWAASCPPIGGESHR